MIWLSWRQFRMQSVAALVFLAVSAAVLIPTGLHLRDLYDAGGIATCRAHGDCATAEASFLSHYEVLRNLLGPILLTVPVLTGIFWGAPLIARELESGTYRLAWTQSIARTRWLAVKLALAGLASIAVAGLFSLMVTWWFSPIDRVNMNRITPGVFDERGLVAIGYAAFAFAVGALAGALLRRTMPAILSTLVAFAGARLAMTYWLRAHLIAPAHTTAVLRSASMVGFEGAGPGAVTFVARGTRIPNAWVYSAQIVDGAGRAPTASSMHAFLRSACPNIGAPPADGGAHAVSEEAFEACVTRLSASFHLAVSYQPASRYWPLQIYETAIFAGLAVILVALCFWWVRHRLS
jgi:hypothetical protein